MSFKRTLLTIMKIIIVLSHYSGYHQCHGTKLLSPPKPNGNLYAVLRLPPNNTITTVDRAFLKLGDPTSNHTDQEISPQPPKTTTPTYEKWREKSTPTYEKLGEKSGSPNTQISSHQADKLPRPEQEGTLSPARPGVDDYVYKIFVDRGQDKMRPFEHFWRSTGLCPPDPHSEAQGFLLSLDEKLNLAKIGSLPNDAIKQVRIHWLLDLIGGRADEAGPSYNYTHLDDLMDHLRLYDLKPGFEIMGNPGNLFNDLENVTQISWWRHLVSETAGRYVGKYGLEWVSSWNWETWNEPDHHDFDTLNFTLQGFLNYYDACRMGLDDVSPRLVFGGPGGSCRNPHFSKICWALLEHCNNGSSLFTPGRPPRIDFISFHKKGKEDADTILDEEIATMNLIYNNYPSLRHVPVINDEADLEVGWWKRREWRADARYAALAARSVIIHQRAKSTIPHFNYKLMSFDNAFLNYRPSFFDQRTLLARFQINSTNPHQVQFVKKPAYTIMSMMSLLGDTTLDYATNVIDDRLSVLATCRNCASGRSPDLASGMRESASPDPASGMRESASQDPASGITKPASGKMEFTKNHRDDPLRSTNHSRESHSTTYDSDPSRIDEPPTEKSIGREANTSNYLVGLGNSEDADKTGITETSADVDGGTGPKSDGSDVPVSWESTLFVSFSNGTEKTDGDVTKVRISFALPASIVGNNLSVVTYRLSGDRKGPFEAWLELGSPIEPNRTELVYIRSFEGPVREGPQLLQDVPPLLNFKVNLTSPEVFVIHICLPSESSPGQVTNVNTLKVTIADVLITWSDALVITRCVSHYEVQRSQAGRDGPFSTISNPNVTDNNYLFSLPQISENTTVTGWYRVRVVTYWGTAGPFSEPVHHVL